MSTKLIPIELEEAGDGAEGRVHAPAVRGGVIDDVEIDEDDGDWPGPIGAVAPRAHKKKHSKGKGGATNPPSAPPPPTAREPDGGAGGPGGYVMRGPMMFRPDVSPPVNMDRVVQEAMPPSPARDNVVQVIDDGGESAYDDVSVQGDEIRTVQVDTGKKKGRKKGGGRKAGAQQAADPTKVVMDL
eukprot:jgi/Mesvir1/21662/Mv04083-RA.1